MRKYSYAETAVWRSLSPIPLTLRIEQIKKCLQDFSFSDEFYVHLMISSVMHGVSTTY